MPEPRAPDTHDSSGSYREPGTHGRAETEPSAAIVEDGYVTLPNVPDLDAVAASASAGRGLAPQ